MSHQSRIAACLLSLALSPAAFAQGSSTESTTVTHTVKSGVVESVTGNKIVVREADGSHEYTLPEGFTFQLDGQNVGIDQIKPGMKVGAVITDKVTTRDVTVTQVASGTVAQVAPGGIVVRDDQGNFRSFPFRDEAGNEAYFVRSGPQSVRNPTQIPLRNVRVGDRLTGTFVTTLPPQTSTQRSVVARAVNAPAAAPAVAAAEPAHLPKTASPLPLIGLLAALSAGLALGLRALRLSR